MKARILMAAAVATLALTGLAHAATAPAKPATASNCFLTQNWQDWRGANPTTIYFRVNVRDIFKLDLASESNMVTDPSNHLISESRGSSWVCNPIDLDLKISDGHIVEPLFIKSITRLTAEQVAAIPKKDLP
ncbi:MAG: hypothetical protein WDN45_10645 [Caulobacteraceae bacterium]